LQENIYFIVLCDIINKLINNVVKVKHHKCVQLLNTLSKKELLKFEQFLQGLYSKQERVMDLFLYIKKYLPINYASNRLNKEYMIEKAFKNGKDAAKNLSNLAGKLRPIVEEFLLFQKIKQGENSFDRYKLLIEVYKERRLDRQFFDTIREAKDLVAAEMKNEWTSLKMMQLHHLTFYTDRFNKNICKKEELVQSVHQLDKFFLALKIKYSSELENRRNILDEQIDTTWLLPHLLTEERSKLSQDDYSDLYLQVLYLLKTKDIIYYQTIKDNFPTYLNSIHPKDLLNVLLYLFNFIALKFRAGDLSLVADYLELYELGLEKEILQIEGYLDANYFVNTVNVACRLERYSWAKQFVEQYLVFIHPNEQEVVEKLTKGILFYEQGAFNNALLLVKTTEFRTPIFSLRLKVLELKCLIELKAKKQALQACCEAFDMFIRREDSLSTNTLTAYKNFVFLVRKIFLYKKQDKKAIVVFVKNNPPLVQKDWIKDKIAVIADSPT